MMPGEPLHTLDNLPYRCPKCGEAANFPSLRLLRQHLEIEHYQGNPLLKHYDIHGNRFKKEDNPEKISPLYHAYSRDAKDLEERLSIAKETERFHRDQWNKFKYLVDKNYATEGISEQKAGPLNENANRMTTETIGGLSPHADLFQVSNSARSHPGNHDKENFKADTSRDSHVSSRSNDSLWTHTHKETMDLRYKIDRLNEQLKFKDSQLKKLTDELVKLTEERLKLQRQMLDMSRQQDESKSRIAYFEGKMDEKDRLIEEKQNELTSLSMFLRDLSIKETAAKQRLEDYVGDLLERTERAESKLRRRESKASTLKSHSFKQHLETLPPDEQDLRSTWEDISANYRDAIESPTVKEPQWTSTPKHPVGLSTTLKFPAPVGPKRALFLPQLTRTQVGVVSPSAMSSYSIGEVIDQSPSNDKPERVESSEPLSRATLPSKTKGSPGSSGKQPRNSIVILPDGTVHEYSTVQHIPQQTYKDSHYVSMKEALLQSGHVRNGEYYNLPGEGHTLQQEGGVRGESRKPVNLEGGEYEQVRHESNGQSETETETESESSSGTVHHEPHSRPCSVGEVHLGSRPHKDQQPDRWRSSKHAHDWKNTSLQEQRRRESLYCVFMYLDTKTLSVVSQVCREWRQVSRDPSLWRQVVLTNTKIASQYLSTLSTWCTQLQVLHLSGLKPRSMKKKESKTEYERSIRGSLELGLQDLLRVSGNTLISLKVIDCGEIITDRCLWLAGCHSPHLERLAYISDTDPVGVESVYALGAGCRNITTLLVQPQFPNHKPHRFNNKTVHRIGQCWPQLRVLCIGGVDVDAKGLAYLARHCQWLEVLELDHLREVGEDTARAMCTEGLKTLATLEFTFTPVTPKALLVLSNSCPKLKKLKIDIGISDYYEDIMNPVHRKNYEEIVYKLKSLKKRPGLKGKLQITTDHG